jgi:hypothetical protein
LGWFPVAVDQTTPKWSQSIVGNDRICAMEKELTIGPQRVLFDRKQRSNYTVRRSPSRALTVAVAFLARTSQAQRGKVVPEEFGQFLGALGIDPRKEWEAFDYDFGVNPSGHLYGGWFLFVGELAEGPHKGIEPQQQPFVYWFTTSFPTVTFPNGLRLCALELLVRIPWVLSELT